MAVGSGDASEVVVRVVNWGPAVNISILLEDVIAPSSVDIAVLAGQTGGDYEQNTPWNPTAIYPTQYMAAYTPSTQYQLDANTFTIFSFAGIGRNDSRSDIWFIMPSWNNIFPKSNVRLRSVIAVYFLLLIGEVYNEWNETFAIFEYHG